jgi:SAM-dependent methyltransferase
LKLCLACDKEFESDEWRCPRCDHEPKWADSTLCFTSELSQTGDGYPSGAHDSLFELEAGHFWFRARNQIILWALAKHFPAAQSFFEIGCGTGFVLSGVGAQHPGMKLFGSERLHRGLYFTAQRLPQATLYQMDARKIPFKNHFDVIGAFDVLEHIEEDTLVLDEMFRAANSKTGGVILTVPQHKFLWSTVDEYACHLRRYSAKELNNKLVRAGFQVLRLTSFNSLLLPMMMISRVLKRNHKVDNFDPMSEFRIPSFVNRGLEAVMAVEKLSIQSGVSWPMGGSLLAVAKVPGNLCHHK